MNAVLCLGPGEQVALAQAAQALSAGCGVLVVGRDAVRWASPLVDAGTPVRALDGLTGAGMLGSIDGIDLVAAAGASEWTRTLRLALAGREGSILPLETKIVAPARYYIERHLCIDTTAAGGNASLPAAGELVAVPFHPL